ncbi:hypothetical protein LSH36_232g03022 [Paralvinella palmiformis]|uniref:YDG domain-containing protein n=1 Tax=Paralvinella palmiformis TaxID=53620 RepID=A0AAD9JML3_9ANNE|nr:hypothetical protein LSH36_232g03022 [Paralvinella palmiformis]
MSSYEELRNRNIEDNKRILAELGIRNPFKPLPPVKKRLIKRKRSSASFAETVKRRCVEAVEGDLGTEYSSGRRRSARIKGIVAPDVQEIQDEIDKESEASSEEKMRRQSLANRPMIYGAIPALSGGYEDDIDMGDCFTYTGEGGRDLKGTASNPKNLRTAPQSRDQKLSRGNASLVKSVENKKPVRVIRGYKLRSPFAPEEGYRYDGLYQVEKYWYTTGMAGFGVYKFALRRLTDQVPPPWDIMDNLNNNNSTYKNVDSSDDSKRTYRGHLNDDGSIISSCHSPNNEVDDGTGEVSSTERGKRIDDGNVDETIDSTNNDQNLDDSSHDVSSSNKTNHNGSGGDNIGDNIDSSCHTDNCHDKGNDNDGHGDKMDGSSSDKTDGTDIKADDKHSSIDGNNGCTTSEIIGSNGDWKKMGDCISDEIDDGSNRLDDNTGGAEVGDHARVNGIRASSENDGIEDGDSSVRSGHGINSDDPPDDSHTGKVDENCNSTKISSNSNNNDGIDDSISSSHRTDDGDDDD